VVVVMVEIPQPLVVQVKPIQVVAVAVVDVEAGEHIQMVVLVALAL
jgi:hypothetical protein